MMYQDEKRSKYIFEPYVLEDEKGVFTLQCEYGLTMIGIKYFKKYVCETTTKVEIGWKEFDYWLEEAHALWGYLDIWGDFVPGLLRPELPVVEIYDDRWLM